MVQDSVQPWQRAAKRSARRRVAPSLLSLTAFLCVACASPGPPKPPSLDLPQLVKDLSAERVGSQVLLHWTTPTRTTDDREIKGAMTAELCRETGASPSTPAAKLTACASVRRLSVVSGPSTAVDDLPPVLQADPVMLITYKVKIFNSTGHSAGNSTAAAYAAAGQAPPPLAALQVTGAEKGAILEWQSAATNPADTVDFKRTDLSAPATTVKKAKPAPAPSPGKKKPAQPKKSGEESPNEVHLRASDTPASPSAATAGTIDTSAVMGDTYTYVAQRVRAVQIGSHQLEIQSQPSTPATLVMRDTFPPKTPTGLETISGTAASDSTDATALAAPYIDLSWEPNGETDLAGYRVYRQLAAPDGSPQGPLARLTALPIAVPAYRDVAVKAGQGYIYSVTAVDAAGNESPPSGKALEVVSSEAGASPH